MADTRKILFSVVMPCFNEEKFIETAVRSLADQFVIDNGEILIVDGMSCDGTREVIEKIAADGIPLRIIDNEKRLQSFGLILGIEAAAGEIIVRADAHSIYPPDYVKNLVSLLKEKDAENVGGCMLPVGRTVVQKSVAAAMQHPVGVGDAKFHLGNFEGYVDTVYLGCFRKKLFSEIGTYDPAAYPNEDAELNLRILKAGYKIYLKGDIKVEYFPRNSFRALMRQYYRYGKGRAYTTTKHGKVTSFRQMVPPLFLIMFIFSILITAGALLSPQSGILSLMKYSFPVFITGYLGGLSLAAFCIPGKKKYSFSVKFIMVPAFMIMHFCWAAGFLATYLFKRTI